jgi:hypothetical protein
MLIQEINWFTYLVTFLAGIAIGGWLMGLICAGKEDCPKPEKKGEKWNIS